LDSLNRASIANSDAAATFSALVRLYIHRSIADSVQIGHFDEFSGGSMRGILCTLVMPALLAAAMSLSAQSNPPAAQNQANQPPQQARATSQETLAFWNQTGKRLVDMAEDFPEDKYSFKAQKDERTFGENLVHVADENYRLLSAIKGAPMGPAGGKQLSFDDFKTKDAVVKLVKQVFADGAALLEAQGDAGLSREVKYPYGNFMVHASTAWLDAIEHSAEHYGQLVVYYRVAGMVPPASRPKK
jgi:uncharacterized damage-inducible protein DinB